MYERNLSLQSVIYTTNTSNVILKHLNNIGRGGMKNDLYNNGQEMLYKNESDKCLV